MCDLGVGVGKLKLPAFWLMRSLPLGSEADCQYNLCGRLGIISKVPEFLGLLMMLSFVAFLLQCLLLSKLGLPILKKKIWSDMQMFVS